ncbi:MAG: hypothetical protein NTY46_16535, partial [Candidatus Sumerlaeota bacterium]|nr:hypothetical protein [Candidatus Sumerlaeota bacterium]
MTIPDHPRPNEAAPPQQAENPPAIDVNAIMEQVRRSVAERRNAGIYPAQCRPTVRHVSKTTRDPDASGPPMARLWSDARIDLAGEPVTSHRR